MVCKHEFLTDLILALTVMSRLATHKQDAALRTATSPQGVVELIQYVSECLAWRLNNPQSPLTWALDECLQDFVEAAEFFNLQDFLDSALEVANR